MSNFGYMFIYPFNTSESPSDKISATVSKKAVKHISTVLSKKRDIHYCTSLFSEIYFIFVLKSYLELLHNLLHQLYKILHQFTISYDNLVIYQNRINTVFFDVFKHSDYILSWNILVITVASGNNLLFNMLIASSLISLAPLVATITGSTTIFPALYSVSLSAIT